MKKNIEVTLMCHRPRTQRVGEASQDRELVVLENEYFNGIDSAVRALESIVMIKRAYLAHEDAGNKLFGFEIEERDSFYLKFEIAE